MYIFYYTLSQHIVQFTVACYPKYSTYPLIVIFGLLTNKLSQSLFFISRVTLRLHCFVVMRLWMFETLDFRDFTLYNYETLNMCCVRLKKSYLQYNILVVSMISVGVLHSPPPPPPQQHCLHPIVKPLPWDKTTRSACATVCIM